MLILVFLLLDHLIVNLHFRSFLLLSEIIGQLRSLNISLVVQIKVAFSLCLEAFIQTKEEAKFQFTLLLPCLASKSAAESLWDSV